jgi:hypothetical protein
MLITPPLDSQIAPIGPCGNQRPPLCRPWRSVTNRTSPGASKAVSARVADGILRCAGAVFEATPEPGMLDRSVLAHLGNITAALAQQILIPVGFVIRCRARNPPRLAQSGSLRNARAARQGRCQKSGAVRCHEDLSPSQGSYPLTPASGAARPVVRPGPFSRFAPVADGPDLSAGGLRRCPLLDVPIADHARITRRRAPALGRDACRPRLGRAAPSGADQCDLASPGAIPAAHLCSGARGSAGAHHAGYRDHVDPDDAQVRWCATILRAARRPGPAVGDGSVAPDAGAPGFWFAAARLMLNAGWTLRVGMGAMMIDCIRPAAARVTAGRLIRGAGGAARYSAGRSRALPGTVGAVIHLKPWAARVRRAQG